MTKSRDITAIFKNSLYFTEMKKFLTNVGFNILRKTDFKSLEKRNLSQSFLIVEISKEKNAEEFCSFIEKELNDVYIICILKKKIKITLNNKNLRILVQPFTFNELLKNLSILEKNLHDNMASFRLIDMLYFPTHSKFVDNRNGNTIKLTDLENRLVSYILNNNNGCSKSEILSNVWEHKTFLDTHSMESLIYRLRRKIENDPNNPKILVQIKNKYFLKTI